MMPAESKRPPLSNSASPLVLAALIGVGVMFRLFIWSHATEEALNEMSRYETLYALALREHFFEFISYSPLKPPLIHIIHAVPLLLLTEQAVAAMRIPLVLAAGFNLAASALIYLAACRFGVRWPIGVVAAGLFSAGIVVTELRPLDYDLPVHFFQALFLYAGARYLCRPTGSAAAALAAVGVVLVAQSTIQALVAPVAAAGFVLLLDRAADMRRLTLRLCVVTLPLIACAGLISLKNYIATGFATTSTLGGHTLMLVVMGLHHWNAATVREVAVKAGVPEWWLWCYDHPADWGNRGPFEQFMRTAGVCFPLLSEQASADRPPPHIDLVPLESALRSLGELQAALIVAQDIETMARRPYLLSGVSPDGATRWFAQYGKVSTEVAREAFLQDPAAWLRNAKYIHGNVYAAAKHDYFREQLDHLAQKIPWLGGFTASSAVDNVSLQLFSAWRRAPYYLLPYVVLLLAAGSFSGILRRFQPLHAQSYIVRAGICLLALAMATLLWLGFKPIFDWFYYGFAGSYYLRPLQVCLLVFAVTAALYLAGGPRIGKALTPMLEGATPAPSTLAAAWILAAPVLMLSVLFCSVVGTENQRFFAQSSVFLTVLAAWLLNRLFSVVALASQAFRHPSASSLPYCL